MMCKKMIYCIGLFFIIGCQHDIVLDNICLNDIIKKGYKCGKGASLSEYLFNNKKVYVYSPGDCCCDFSTDVYNEKCEQICILGGFGGFTKCDGVDFFENAQKVKVIWRE